MSMRCRCAAAMLFLISCQSINAQDADHATDTLKSKRLSEIIITTYLKNSMPKYLPEISGMSIYSGKKTNNILLDNSKMNLSQNITRTALAQVPGLTMWDMDGAGLQINVGSRGTDSHRSIEMNMRQNGYNTNSDMFGYPEDHYTPPMQGIQRIELVRGSAALQFGSQFGGMMNYVMKKGDSTKAFSVETEQTMGSDNFYNSYIAVGGTKGKLNYYAYADFRTGDGWRDNSDYKYHAYYLDVNYQFNAKAKLGFQFSRMSYVQQIAGGLTDAQFKQNNRQSFRERNFFNPEINIPALTFDYQFSSKTKLEVKSHVLFGERNSVQFIASPVIMDTINASTLHYNPRQVDRDYYNGFTTEARLLHSYELGTVKSTLAGGLRFSTEMTKRKQKGHGTNGINFDLSIDRPYGTDLRFTTDNYAAFVENIFQLNEQFSITPGVRYEIINSHLTGKINNATDVVSYKGDRHFPLFGAGLQYQLNKISQLYGNISQAYRPYLYSNITPADRVDVIDPNLKDSKGYDIDLGYRGHYKDVLNFDANLYYLFYGNRVGLLTQKNTNNSSYLFTTNIGDAVTKGAEVYVEFSLLKSLTQTNKLNDIRIFNSLSYSHSRYKNGEAIKAGINTSLAGNRVENVPDWMNKTGVTFQHKQITTMFQFSYTSMSYNDALNTTSSANGITGVIPSYSVWDWSINWDFSKPVHISAGINNFTNEKYFSRRITFYPGPGILPADGRTFYISLGLKL